MVVVSFVEKKEETIRCVRLNDIIKKKQKEKRLVNLDSLVCDFLLALSFLLVFFLLCQDLMGVARKSDASMLD